MIEFATVKLGFCSWDILALLVLVAVIAIFVVSVVRQKRLEKELENELTDAMAQDAAKHQID